MYLPQEEWLPLAKRIGIGSSRRVRHRNEGRANLVVYNKPEGWSAWCHACGQGGFVPKEHVRYSEPVAADPDRMPLPADLLHRDQWDTQLEQHVASFLASKGLDLEVHTSNIPMGYSASTERLVMGCQAQDGLHWLGRAMNPRQAAKWVQYQAPLTGYAAYAMPVPASRTVSRAAVLVEDYLSAIKVEHADPTIRAAAVLGTRVNDKLVLELLEARLPVYLMLDGDQACKNGAARMRTRLLGLGLTVHTVCTPDGLDPKDLHTDAIRRLICEQ